MVENTNKGVNRRQFVSGAAGIAAGVPVLVAGASTTSRQVECISKGCDYDVIVIGGGFAGLTAARDSSKNGLKPLLLEARNRLGGRTFGADFEGTAIEMGGAWIHNTQPFVWAETERYGLEVKETPGAVAELMQMVMPDGERFYLTLDQYGEVIAGWEHYCAAAREIVPRPYDLMHNREAVLQADATGAVQHLDGLDLTPLQYHFNKAYIALIVSNKAEEMSYLEVIRFFLLGGGDFLTFMDATARFQLKDGSESLVAHIAEDGEFETRLATPVRSVTDSGDRVEVMTSRGEKLTCSVLVCTVPMNALGNVAFSPPLPAGVNSAATEGHPGQGVKIYIKVKGDIGNMATVASHLPFTYVMTYKQADDHTLLVGFTSGPDEVDAYDEEAVQRALRQHLPEVDVVSVMHYDWNNDPYSRGTWETYRSGWVDKYYEAFRQETGRVLIASGDLGEGWRGTIDGAIGAGVRAARKAAVMVGRG